MRRAVLSLHRIFRIFLVHAVSRHLVHPLVQCSSQHDIQFLEPAAKREYRDTGIECAPGERQCRLVPLPIVKRSFLARLAAIMMRLDIRQATGEKQSVEVGKPLVDFDALPERRNDYRESVCPVADRGEIFFPRHVKRMRLEDLPISRDSNYWSGTHMRTLTRRLRVS